MSTVPMTPQTWQEKLLYHHSGPEKAYHELSEAQISIAACNYACAEMKKIMMTTQNVGEEHWLNIDVVTDADVKSIYDFSPIGNMITGMMLHVRTMRKEQESQVIHGVKVRVDEMRAAAKRDLERLYNSEGERRKALTRILEDAYNMSINDLRRWSGDKKPLGEWSK